MDQNTQNIIIKNASQADLDGEDDEDGEVVYGEGLEMGEGENENEEEHEPEEDEDGDDGGAILPNTFQKVTKSKNWLEM